MTMHCSQFESQLQADLDARRRFRWTVAARRHAATCTNCARLARGVERLERELPRVASRLDRGMTPPATSPWNWMGVALAASLAGVVIWRSSPSQPTGPNQPTGTPPANGAANSVADAKDSGASAGTPSWRPLFDGDWRLDALAVSVPRRLPVPRDRLLGAAAFGFDPISGTVGAAVQALHDVLRRGQRADGEAPPSWEGAPSNSAAWANYTDCIA